MGYAAKRLGQLYQSLVLRRVGGGSTLLGALALSISCGTPARTAINSRTATGVTGVTSGTSPDGTGGVITNFPPAKGACVSYDLFHSLAEPKLTASCSGCHGPGASMNKRFGVGEAGDDHDDFKLAQAKVDLLTPSRSLIILKPTGQVSHGGGAIYSANGPEAKILLAWANEEQRCANLTANTPPQGALVPTPAAAKDVLGNGTQFSLPTFPASCPTYKTFVANAVPVLANNCGGCHGAGGASNSIFPINSPTDSCSALATTWHQTEQRVNIKSVADSLLLRKATGMISHTGGAALVSGTSDYQVINDWIAAEQTCAAAGYNASSDANLDPCNATPWHLLIATQSSPIYVGNVSTIAAGLKLSDGSDGVLTAATWVSSSPAIAAIDNNGKLTAVAAGRATITLTVGSISTSTDVVIDAAPIGDQNLVSLKLDATTLQVDVGATKTATLSGVTTGGVTLAIDAANWASSDATLATVDATGKVTGVALGTATITATVGSLTATATVNVVNPALVSLALSTAAQTTRVGDRAQYVATGTFDDQSVAIMATSAVTWASSSVSRAKVDSNGLVSFLSSGAVTITATAGTVTSAVDITIGGAYYSNISISPDQAVLSINATTQLQATGKMSDGTNAPTGVGLAWSSSDPTVATVTSSGLVTAVATGFVLITAVDGTVRGSTAVVVQSGANCSTEASFAADIQPLLDDRCVSCHALGGVAAPYFLMKGPNPDASGLAQNFLGATKRMDPTTVDQSLLLQKVAGAVPHGPNTQPVLAVGTSDYTLLRSWVNSEATCELNTTKSNLARSSAEVMLLRLKTLFPLANTTPPGQVSYSGILQPSTFDVYASTGLMRVIATPDRSITPAAQIALRGAIAQLCYTYNTANTNLFNETGILLSGETFPSDALTRLAFDAARNAWLYPYTATSPEVLALKAAYTAGKAAPYSSLTADATGRLLTCVAALVAPQFWSGNPGDDDVVRRVSLEIGRTVPKMADFAAFRNAADKVSFMGDFTRNLQTSTATQPGYFAAVHAWHKDWLGLRDFVAPAPSKDRGGNSIGNAAGMGYMSELDLTPAVSGFAAPQRVVYASNQYSKSNVQLSEACTAGKVQEFDPVTTQMVWQHFNHFNSTWETVGSWVKTGGTWTMQPGQITLADGSTLVTGVADITSPIIGTDLKNQYVTGKLVGTPVDDWVLGERRVRRYAAGGEQDGYSEIQTWYAGEKVKVCNTVSRYPFACYYRPPTKPTSSKIWDASQSQPALAQTAPLDSIAHPVLLDNFRCGVPDYSMITNFGTANYSETVAYPAGSPGNYNVLAHNLFGWNFAPTNADLNPDIFTTALTASAETRAKGRLGRDILQEPNRLLDHILGSSGDYRQFLTAPYTFGGAELDLYYRQAAQWIPTYPPGYVSPTSEADAQTIRTISASSLQTLPFGLLSNSWAGCLTGMPCPLSTPLANWPAPIKTYKTAGGIPGRTMSGILTQAGFLGPISVNNGKARSIAARVFSRLLCSLPSDFLSTLDTSGTALSKTFMQTHETTTSLHLDETKGCYTCHVLLDPVASIFNKRFMSTIGAGTQQPSVGELNPAVAYNQNTLLGVLGGGNESSGAFLGKPVTGITQLGTEIANSPQFAHCVVQKAFTNVFGRDPSGSDFAVIDRVTGSFSTTLGYDYNQMVEELVKTPEFMKGN